MLIYNAQIGIVYHCYFFAEMTPFFIHTRRAQGKNSTLMGLPGHGEQNESSPVFILACLAIIYDHN